MSRAPRFPTADEVAHAIVTAAALCSEDPIQCAEGVMGLRCRYYVIAALVEQFPDVANWRLAIYSGCTNKTQAENMQRAVRKAPKALKWWDRRKINQVIDAVRRARRAPAPLVVEPAPPAPPAGPATRQHHPLSGAEAKPAGRLQLPHRIFTPAQPRDNDEVTIKRAGPQTRVPYIPRPVRAPLTPNARVADLNHVVDIAASLMGDPPPGRSALARRQQRNDETP